MTTGWSELDLKRVGWQAEAWPAIDDLEMKSTATGWRALREYVSDIRANLSAFDGTATGIDSDKTLTDMGKAEKAKLPALIAIGNCENPTAIARLEEQVKLNIKSLESKMTGIPAMPEDPVSAMMCAEIRAHLASEPKAQRLAKARQLLNDSRVCSALFNAPAFLSGISEEEQKLLRTEAELVLHPAERKARDQLAEALDVARTAASMAVNKVAERAKLAKGADGKWVLKQMHPTAPAPRVAA